jgi:Flp pilus assembly protein TadG
MASFVLTDASVVINAVDLSDHVQSVTVNYAAEMVDETAMGDDTRTNKGGLKNWSLDLQFKQDHAASNVDATLFPLVGSTFTVTVKPTSAVVSATNPSYSGTGILESYAPVSGGVGDLATTSVTIQSAGTLSRATA